ncbi:MAG TPA: type IV secretion system DNA-binding domain-containing protein [Thermoanaerobaculia bacterium]|nr:type IV secretion system DNA-binding domain-containing protein [Thermoanaerobaculia bacterium]
MEHDITYFARTNHRNTGTPFGIRRADRRNHMYAIGKTGTGKSTLLKTLILQDIENGEGLALFDPHGDLAEEIVSLVPPERGEDLIYLDVPNMSQVWHFNPFAGIPKEQRALAAAGMVEVFKKLWPDDWGPRLEHLLRNVVYTLLEAEGSLADIPRLLSERGYRKAIVQRITNEAVRTFWEEEFAGYSPAFRAVVTAPLQNKVGAFLIDPHLQSILSGRESSFDLREIIDQGKLLVVSLAKGKLGEGPAALLGSLLVSHLSLAGLGRANLPQEKRRDFYLYLDEFHTFSTLTLATMLSELRKYRLNLILAHQYLGQLEPEIRDAVFGNVGTFIAFRVGALDAPTVARELSPTFEADDLLSLPNFSVYLRLMIDGEPSRAFSGEASLRESRQY